MLIYKRVKYFTIFIKYLIQKNNIQFDYVAVKYNSLTSQSEPYHIFVERETGTVTGAVAGAMANGAIGFVEGAALGVAADLLGTCFRNIMNVDVWCGRFFDRFRNGEITAADIPRDCTSNIEVSFE